MIPDPIKRWATTNVVDHYYPYLLYMDLLAMEIAEARKKIQKAIEEESDRRLELLRVALSSPP